MPIATTYKGVGIHADQSAKRVARVKREIDEIGSTADLMQLYEIAGDCSWSPEARRYAGARCIAGLQRATERREPRPDIDVANVEARTAGLGTVRWAHPGKYCTILDVHDERAAPREQPLDEAE